MSKKIYTIVWALIAVIVRAIITHDFIVEKAWNTFFIALFIVISTTYVVSALYKPKKRGGYLDERV